jgi:hypothetical protein
MAIMASASRITGLVSLTEIYLYARIPDGNSALWG